MYASTIKNCQSWCFCIDILLPSIVIFNTLERTYVHFIIYDTIYYLITKFYMSIFLFYNNSPMYFYDSYTKSKKTRVELIYFLKLFQALLSRVFLLYISLLSIFKIHICIITTNKNSNDYRRWRHINLLNLILRPIFFLSISHTGIIFP